MKKIFASLVAWWRSMFRKTAALLPVQIAPTEPRRFGSFRLQHESKRARARRIEKFKAYSAHR